MKNLFLLFFFLAQEAQSYPNFIHMGYSSCAGCHYNPMGNGPLTDYGRTVSASGIAARDFWDKQATDEEVAEKSSFLRMQPLFPWLRTGLNLRVLHLRQATTSGLRLMDMSADIVVKPSTSFWLSAKFDPKDILGREYYAAYKINKAIGLYAGFMDKAFGIRVPDHIAYSRMFTENSYDDQSHGLMVHFFSKPIELAAHALLGNLKDEQELRKQGFSFTGEFEPAPSIRLGGSFMKTKNQFNTLQAFAPHLRLGVNHHTSILLEVGSVNDSEIKKTYIFNQIHHLLRSGLFALISLEHARPDMNSKTKLYRITPGLQYFPNHGWELRLETAYRWVDTGMLRIYQRDLMLQTHMYF